MTEFEEYQFQGKAMDIAETEFAGSIRGDHGEALLKQILDEYKAAGCPKQKKVWIKERLKNVFECVAERPQWVQEFPDWPWLDGKPMIFIKQFDVPATPLVAEKLATSKVLYIFGARRPAEGGLWKMEYRVVAQDRDLGKGVVALAKDKAALHSGDPKQFILVRRKCEDS